MADLAKALADELSRIDPQQGGIEAKAERLAAAVERARRPEPPPDPTRIHQWQGDVPAGPAASATSRRPSTRSGASDARTVGPAEEE